MFAYIDCCYWNFDVNQCILYDNCLLLFSSCVQHCKIRNNFIRDLIFSRDEQKAFRKFAKSLEMVPKSLAKNGGYEGRLIIDTLNKRYEAYSETNLGVDLKNGICKDVSDINIWDLLSTK